MQLDKKNTLQGLVIIRKTALTRLCGPDDGTANSLLLKKLDSLIATCTSFPELSSIHTQSIRDFVHKLSVDVEQAKHDFCACLSNIARKCASLEVPTEHKNTLVTAFTNYTNVLGPLL